MKAAILAAGFATRLRPLSRERPKVLFPLIGGTILDYLEGALVKHDIKKLLINSHHLSKQIAKIIEQKNRQGDVRYRLSNEEKILGTAGGIKKIFSLAQEEEELLFINGDIFFQGNLDQLINSPLRGKSLVTLLLLPWNGREERGLTAIDEKQRVTAIPASKEEIKDRQRAGIFSGIYLVHRQALPYFPQKTPSCIVQDVIQAIISQGLTVSAEIIDLDWQELGTIKSYYDFCLSQLAGEENYIDRQAQVTDSSKIKPRSIIFEGAKIKAGAIIDKSIIWPEVTIAANSSITKAIASLKNITRVDR